MRHISFFEMELKLEVKVNFFKNYNRTTNPTKISIIHKIAEQQKFSYTF